MIREAEYSDLHNILPLYRELFPDEDYRNPDAFEATWRFIIEDPKIQCIIAFSGETPVSTCTLTIIPNLTRNQRPYALIENVVTAKKFRRAGFGRCILLRAIESAKAEGCYKIMLMSSTSRKTAHRFYEDIGFDGNSKKGFQFRLP